MLNMMKLDLLGMRSFRINIILRMLVPFTALLLSSEPWFAIPLMAFFM